MFMNGETILMSSLLGVSLFDHQTGMRSQRSLNQIPADPLLHRRICTANNPLFFFSFDSTGGEVMENPLVVGKDGPEKAEKMLRQFGYKPGQIFSGEDIEEKTRRLFNALKPYERDAVVGQDCDEAEDPEQFFVECILDDLCNNRTLIEVNFRFLPGNKEAGVLQKLRRMWSRRW